MESYYKDPRISQSQLKRFINPNPRSLFRGPTEDDLYYEKESIHFSKGKLLDRLIEGLEITDHYYIQSSDYKHPSARVESIAQECIDLELTDVDDILEIKEKQGYQANYTEKKNIEWVNETILPFIKQKKAIGNKVVVTQKEFNQVVIMTNSMLEGEYTKPILDKYDGEYQVALYTKEFKVLIDYLQLDHTSKVVRVIDFKTTRDYLERFKKSILRFGYHIQMSFYSHVVGLKYPGYTVLPPVLIVGSKREPEWAEPFTLSLKVLEQAKNGWKDSSGKLHIGWLEMDERLTTYNGEMYNKKLIKRGTNLIKEL
jgi:hypothetical protein